MVCDKLGREITVGADCLVKFSGKREWIRCTVRQIRPDDCYPVRVDDGDEDNSDLLTNDFTIPSWVEPWRVKIRVAETKKPSGLRGIARGADVANDEMAQGSDDTDELCLVCGAERRGEHTRIDLDFSVAVVVRWCEECRLNSRDAYITIASVGGRHTVTGPR